MSMTYRELYEKLMAKHADEKGIIRGEPVMILYRVSRYAESVGFDSVVDDRFYDVIRGMKKLFINGDVKIDG